MAIIQRKPKSFFLTTSSSATTPILIAGALVVGLLLGRWTASDELLLASTTNLNLLLDTDTAAVASRNNHTATATTVIRRGQALPHEQEEDHGVVGIATHRLPSSPYTSPFLKTYAKEELDQLNTVSSENQRREARKRTVDTNYLHQEMTNYNFLKLALRTMTVDNIFDEPQIHEPYMSDEGKRSNGGCSQTSPKCLLTWDGWARAMAAGDALYDVIRRGVPGDVVEVGVFKGGISAYFQTMIMAMGETAQRKVWLVDSFKGLPPKSLMVSAVDDSGSANNNSTNLQAPWAGKLSVGLETVKKNLNRMGLLDAGNVGFLEGFVQHTLPNWKDAQEIALLRIDVDIYAPTYDALHFLYPRLTRGGTVLFDDWKLPYSREAITNYRKKHGITTPVQFLNGTVDSMAYWIKE